MPLGDHARGVDVARVLVDQGNVDVQRHVALGDRLPHRVVLRRQVEVTVGVAAEEGADHAGPVDDPLDLLHGRVDTPVGDAA